MSRSKTGFTNGIHISEILDDWNDNKITSRDNAATTETGFTDRFGKIFRPEWSQVSGTTTVSNGRIVLNENNEKIQTSSTQVTGTWEYDFQLDSTGGGDYEAILQFMHDGTDYYQLSVMDDGHIDLQKTGSHLTTPSWSVDTDTHTLKLTRDSSGNMEIFLDGASLSTTTNNDITSSSNMYISNGNNSETSYVDNLKVY